MPSSANSKKRQSPRRQRDLRLPDGSAVPRLTLRHLARLTPDAVIKRGREVSVRPFDLEIDINDVGAYKVAYANTLHNTVVHTTTVLVYHYVGDVGDDVKKLRKLQRIPKGAQLWNKPCWVTCDCEYFLYNCEVALHRFNATDIIHSNGAFPGFTNPQMRPHLCKHLYAFAPVLIGMARHPTGREIPHSRRPQHPPHRGRLPRHLQEHLENHRHVPTEDEVSKGVVSVRDFL